MFGLSKKTANGLVLSREEFEAALNPVQRLAIMLVEMAAVTMMSPAIAIGHRDRAQEEEYDRQGPLVLLPDAEELQPRLSGPEGHMPVWMETEGELWIVQMLHVHVYPSLLTAFDELTVSIDASAGEQRPPFYIEITPTLEGKRFVEVALELDRGNVFWVRVMRVRKVRWDSN
jgi:hypothetical protein